MLGYQQGKCLSSKSVPKLGLLDWNNKFQVTAIVFFPGIRCKGLLVISAVQGKGGLANESYLPTLRMKVIHTMFNAAKSFGPGCRKRV